MPFCPLLVELDADSIDELFALIIFDVYEDKMTLRVLFSMFELSVLT